MTDDLFQKLEEKVMVLVSELEDSRKEINQLRHENSILRAEKSNFGKKLQNLIGLLDEFEVNEAVPHTSEALILQSNLGYIAAEA